MSETTEQRLRRVLFGGSLAVGSLERLTAETERIADERAREALYRAADRLDMSGGESVMFGTRIVDVSSALAIVRSTPLRPEPPAPAPPPDRDLMYWKGLAERLEEKVRIERAEAERLCGVVSDIEDQRFKELNEIASVVAERLSR